MVGLDLVDSSLQFLIGGVVGLRGSGSLSEVRLEAIDAGLEFVDLILSVFEVSLKVIVFGVESVEVILSEHRDLFHTDAVGLGDAEVAEVTEGEVGIGMPRALKDVGEGIVDIGDKFEEEGAVVANLVAIAKAGDSSDAGDVALIVDELSRLDAAIVKTGASHEIDRPFGVGVIAHASVVDRELEACESHSIAVERIVLFLSGGPHTGHSSGEAESPDVVKFLFEHQGSARIGTASPIPAIGTALFNTIDAKTDRPVAPEAIARIFLLFLGDRVGGDSGETHQHTESKDFF